ncbi:MAG: hypothetical protein ACYC18_05070 [Gammaproteobacteria bacterium]
MTQHITISIDDRTVAALDELVGWCNEANRAASGCTSHGALTRSRLLAMLAEDAGQVVTRPGSWEGAGMRTLLNSHGY